jgi:hypothetical protein
MMTDAIVVACLTSIKAAPNARPSPWKNKDTFRDLEMGEWYCHLSETHALYIQRIPEFISSEDISIVEQDREISYTLTVSHSIKRLSLYGQEDNLVAPDIQDPVVQYHSSEHHPITKLSWTTNLTAKIGLMNGG